MFSRQYSVNTLSLLIFISSTAWGVYWIPLRAIEGVGISGSWAVVMLNACPLLILCPLFIFNYKKMFGNFKTTIFASLMIGSAFSFYAYGLIETTIIRATLLFYISPIWATAIGVIWLNERFTRARVVSIGIGLLGLFLLLSQENSMEYPLNVGDIFAVLSGICWAIGGSTLKKYSYTHILSISTFVYMSTTVISVLFAILFYMDPFPSITAIKVAFPTAAIWSIFILAPAFIVVFKISTILFPGRVGILMMSEVIVAIISASILVPEEMMVLIQWIGAIGIVAAAFIEVFYGNESS
ncbi:DMT family transporter [Paracoccaceae bacterium]|nr:DMT family transporter [Paracoccaceae bacterium]